MRERGSYLDVKKLQKLFLRELLVSVKIGLFKFFD